MFIQLAHFIAYRDTFGIDGVSGGAEEETLENRSETPRDVNRCRSFILLFYQQCCFELNINQYLLKGCKGQFLDCK